MGINLKVKYYPDGRWDGGGMLPPHLKDFSNLAVWIKDFLTEVKDLRKYYISSIHGDGRLLGQEKANIVIQMDEILGGLLLFRRYISENSNPEISSSDPDGNSFAVKLLENTWVGSGKLTQSNDLDQMSFSELHNDVIMDRIRDVFLKYGEAGKDRIITPPERIMINEKIDIVFIQLLRIERLLLYTNRAH